ncbi:MAG: cytochrome c oxidase assembly protein [Proteobacteria bacterium]|nr:cytochrome c oxidase assembly protein [Pseudomonadota bacterium]
MRSDLAAIKAASKLHQGREAQGVHDVVRANFNIIDTEVVFPDEKTSRIDFAALRLGGERPELVFYEAKNLTGEKLTGTATFNVTPQAAGSYFNKIECFCFTEQTLEPGARAKLPLTFFIDPEIVNDPEARNIQEITLSYTFFPVKQGAEVAAGKETKSQGG